MEVSGIIALNKISDHFYVAKEDLDVQDVLKAFRKVIEIEAEPTYIFVHNSRLVYKGEQDAIPKGEFLEAARRLEKETVKYRIGKYYSKDHLRQLLKAKSSAKKSDLVEEAVKGDNLYAVKRAVFDTVCTKFAELTEGNNTTTIPISNEKIAVIRHYPHERSDALTPKGAVQYWTLSEHTSFSGLEKTVSQHRESCFIPDINTAFLNTKDADEKIMEALKSLKQSQIGFYLRPYGLKLFNESALSGNEIAYLSDIEYLTEYFGERKQSKYQTFCHGLQKRKSAELAKAMTNKKFLLSSNPPSVGKPCRKEDFERLASYMRIDFSESRQVVATVTEEETSELLAAAWNIWGESGLTFFMSQLN